MISISYQRLASSLRRLISFLFFLNRACQNDFLTPRASKIDRNTIDNNYHLQ